MGRESIVREFSSLPPEAQRQVLQFMAFLRSRYKPISARRKGKRTELSSEAFVGMWRDHEAILENTSWVRSIRKRHWAAKSD